MAARRLGGQAGGLAGRRPGTETVTETVQKPYRNRTETVTVTVGRFYRCLVHKTTDFWRSVRFGRLKSQNPSESGLGVVILYSFYYKPDNGFCHGFCTVSVTVSVRFLYSFCRGFCRRLCLGSSLLLPGRPPSQLPICCYQLVTDHLHIPQNRLRLFAICASYPFN